MSSSLKLCEPQVLTCYGLATQSIGGSSHHPISFTCLSSCHAPSGPVHTPDIAVLSCHCPCLEFPMLIFPSSFLAGSALLSNFPTAYPKEYSLIFQIRVVKISVYTYIYVYIYLYLLATWIVVWWSRICHFKAKSYCPQAKGPIKAIDKQYSSYHRLCLHSWFIFLRLKPKQMFLPLKQSVQMSLYYQKS